MNVSAPRRGLERFDYKYLVAMAVVFGLFMDIMDTTIVNVALPRLAIDFNADTNALEWVVTGYLLSLAVWIPASGWVGDHFGTKRTFLFAMAAFVCGSGLCGAAWNIESLAFFRVLQGVGGGMMTPVGMAMLFRAFPPRERPRASALMFIPTSVAPMTGPLLGGFLVDNVSWRWIFYVNVPVGVIGFVFVLFALREHKERGAGRFDPLGFVLSGIGLASVLLALSLGPDEGWSSPIVLVSLVGGLVCLAALVYVETHKDAPMLDLTLFRDQMFRSANAVMFFATCAMLGVLFLLPLYLQQLRGLSAFESGLTTFPQAFGTVIMVQLASRLYPRIGARASMLIGTIGLTAVSCLFLLIDLSTPTVLIDGIMLLRGMCMPFVFVANQAAAFSTISSARTGRASSLFSTQRQVAAAFGVAVLATILSVAVGNETSQIGSSSADVLGEAQLRAFHTAFAGAVVFAVLAVAASLTVGHEPSAVTVPGASPAGTAMSVE